MRYDCMTCNCGIGNFGRNSRWTDLFGLAVFHDADATTPQALVDLKNVLPPIIHYMIVAFVLSYGRQDGSR